MLCSLLEGQQQPLEFTMWHLLCQRGLLCCAAQGIYHRESSVPGNSRDGGGWLGCAHVLQQQHRDTSMSWAPRHQSPSVPSAGLAASLTGCVWGKAELPAPCLHCLLPASCPLPAISHAGGDAAQCAGEAGGVMDGQAERTRLG